IDSMIHQLQQELVDIAALKSGIIWREKGERSARYLKSIHQQRTTQQYIPSLRVSDVPPTATTADDIMQEYAHQFYQTLYSTDPITTDDLSRYLDNVHFPRLLHAEDTDTLLYPITLEDLLFQ
ncbi:MAG: hypothetical protein EXX96DRAFT_458044, partial [Benjaminiella poitrasii]